MQRQKQEILTVPQEVHRSFTDPQEQRLPRFQEDQLLNKSNYDLMGEKSRGMIQRKK